MSSAKLKSNLDEVQSRLPAAWVTLDGTTCTAVGNSCRILSSYNVSAVTLTAITSDGTSTPTYSMTFANPLPDAKFAMFGSATSANVCQVLGFDMLPTNTNTGALFRVVTNCNTALRSPYISVMVMH
jgi:hypothetical protein